MFDRGLLSIDDDYSPATRLLNPDGRLRLPDRPDLFPHPKFLDYYRREIFKG